MILNLSSNNCYYIREIPIQHEILTCKKKFSTQEMLWSCCVFAKTHFLTWRKTEGLRLILELVIVKDTILKIFLNHFHFFRSKKFNLLLWLHWSLWAGYNLQFDLPQLNILCLAELFQIPVIFNIK